MSDKPTPEEELVDTLIKDKRELLAFLKEVLSENIHATICDYRLGKDCNCWRDDAIDYLRGIGELK